MCLPTCSEGTYQMGVGKLCCPGWPASNCLLHPCFLHSLGGCPSASLELSSPYLLALAFDTLGMRIRNLLSKLALINMSAASNWPYSLWRGIYWILFNNYLFKSFFFSCPHSLGKSEKRQFTPNFSMEMENTMQFSLRLKTEFSVVCWKTFVGPCYSSYGLWSTASPSPGRL